MTKLFSQIKSIQQVIKCLINNYYTTLTNTLFTDESLNVGKIFAQAVSHSVLAKIWQFKGKSNWFCYYKKKVKEICTAIKPEI